MQAIYENILIFEDYLKETIKLDVKEGQCLLVPEAQKCKIYLDSFKVVFSLSQGYSETHIALKGWISNFILEYSNNSNGLSEEKRLELKKNLLQMCRYY